MVLVLPRSLFFHIPKTGGSWVRTAIENAGIPTRQVHDKHWEPGKFFETEDGRACMSDGVFTFSFVRHPLTWHQSFWGFCMDGNWKYSNAWHTTFCASGYFDVYMRNKLCRDSGRVSKIYKEFTADVRTPLHFIGRQESLVDDLVKALQLAEEDFDEEKLRATPMENQGGSLPRWKKFCTYTPELEEEVRESERWAMEMFGYI